MREDAVIIINKILWERWDPIGRVPENEYINYAREIAAKLSRGEGKKELLDYLFWAVSENMGFNCIKEEADIKNAPAVDEIINTLDSK